MHQQTFQVQIVRAQFPKNLASLLRTLHQELNHNQLRLPSGQLPVLLIKKRRLYLQNRVGPGTWRLRMQHPLQKSRHRQGKGQQQLEKKAPCVRCASVGRKCEVRRCRSRADATATFRAFSNVEGFPSDRNGSGGGRARVREVRAGGRTRCDGIDGR